MSFISKDHFNMALKGVKKLVDQISKNIVQSDWNETDETSKAYIQNKPFEEKGTEYTFVDLKDAPISGQGAAVLSSTCEYELIPGNIYKVIIDGVEKEVECVVLPAYAGRRYLMLGADSAWNNNAIYQWAPDKSYIYAFTTWNSGTSVKVIGRTQPPKKLSEQYIPDTIARVSDVDEIKGEVFCGSCDTGSGTSAKVVTVSDSSFVLKYGVMIYVRFTNANTSSSTLTLNVNSTGAKQIKLANSVYCSWGPGSYITFLYDGTYWQMISLSPGEASTNYYGITKLSSSISSTSTSIAATPSAVKQAYDLANKALPKSGGTLTGNLTLKGDPTSNLQAATKQYVDNAVKNVNIPEQVQADWNQDEDTAIDFIKNKTHYDSKKLLVEQVYTLDDNGQYREYDPSFTLEVGVEYEVIFDDVIYQCIGQDCYGNPDYGAYIGNGSYANRPSSSEEPFFIKYENYYDGPIFSIFAEVPGSHKIIISKGKLKQLDEKFIPDTIARKTDIPEVDLTGLATEQYVDKAIEAIDIPEADLTNYATKDYVDNAIDGLDIPSIEGLATEQYVDDAIANAQLGGSGDCEVPEVVAGGIPFSNVTTKLIVDITITPDENGALPQYIEITERNDGTPLNLKAFVFQTDIKTGASYTICTYNDNGWQSSLPGVGHGDKRVSTTVILTKDGSIMSSIGLFPVGSNSGLGELKKAEVINKLKIPGTLSMTAGTFFRLWEITGV